MRTPLVAGNWKMNTSLADAHILAKGVKDAVVGLDGVEVVLCPPSIWLAELAHEVVAPSAFPNLRLGAQNMHFEEKGAFTGEVSPLMVREVAEYVILGHSERTHVFGEGVELVARKVEAAFEHDLTPILCIGEDVQSDTSKDELVKALEELIGSLLPEQLERLVLAYEPVWAIGSGNPATPEYAQEVVAALRTRLTPNTRILYGGSANAENAGGFLAQEDIDGLLVGGASLKLNEFVTMVKDASRN